MANVKIPSSPPTSVECYQSGTGCRRDGRGSGASSHHELDTLANEYASTISLCELEQSAKNPSPASSKSSGCSHVYPRTSLSTFLRIPRYRLLTTSPHQRGALLTYHPLNSSHDFWVDWNLFYYHQPCWGRLEKRTSDLTTVHIFILCKI